MPNSPGTRPARLVVDGWYAKELKGHVSAPIVAVDEAVIARFPRTGHLLLRRGGTRALALLVATRATDTVVTPDAALGARWLIGFSAALGRRNLVLLEYINHAPNGTGPRSMIRRLEFVLLRRMLLPHALRAAQVFTRADKHQYARTHHVQATRFQHVPWPARFDATATLPERIPAGRAVLCSGRRVDWATFAAAARGSDWKITAVCTAPDAEQVENLLKGTDATIHVDIDLEAHYALVGAATVYVVALPETGASIGQVRIMNAADAGTPLVISRVQGVEEYVDNHNAVLVEPHDPHALRQAVSALLDDPDRQQELRHALFHRGASYDMTNYLNRLGEMLTRTAAEAQNAIEHP